MKEISFLVKEPNRCCCFCFGSRKTLLVSDVLNHVQFERQPGCSWFQALSETRKTEKFNQPHKAAV